MNKEKLNKLIDKELDKVKEEFKKAQINPPYTISKESYKKLKEQRKRGANITAGGQGKRQNNSGKP